MINLNIPEWGVEMAQSATPCTHPWQSKFTTILTKRIYLPGFHSTGYLGLRGLTPRNSGKSMFVLFSAEKQCHHVPQNYETSPT